MLTCSLIWLCLDYRSLIAPIVTVCSRGLSHTKQILPESNKLEFEPIQWLSKENRIFILYMEEIKEYQILGIGFLVIAIIAGILLILM